MKNEDILEAFDKMTAQIENAYAAVRKCLEEDDLVGAQDLLARIGRVHAKSSVSLRSVLIRRGLVKGE